jgi:hypothetical protein
MKHAGQHIHFVGMGGHDGAGALSSFLHGMPQPPACRRPVR